MQVQSRTSKFMKFDFQDQHSLAIMICNSQFLGVKSSHILSLVIVYVPTEFVWSYLKIGLNKSNSSIHSKVAKLEYVQIFLTPDLEVILWVCIIL